MMLIIILFQEEKKQIFNAKTKLITFNHYVTRNDFFLVIHLSANYAKKKRDQY